MSDNGVHPSVVVAAAAVGSLFGAGTTFWLLGTKRSNTGGLDRRDVQQASSLSSFPFGLPTAPFVTKHMNSEFALGFDRRLRSATWAYERLTAASLDGNKTKRRSSFLEDVSEPAVFRAKNAYYKGSGLDKGHLAPAGDFCVSQQAMDDSFSLANTCPQDPGLNRGFWAKKVEPFVRRLTAIFDEVHVVTGPLYLPSFDGQQWRAGHQYIGHLATAAVTSATSKRDDDALGDMPVLPVPTHFYKVVLGVRWASKTGMLAAFIIPNKPVDSSTHLTKFQVPVKVLEAFAGHMFFPNRAKHLSVVGELCSTTDGGDGDVNYCDAVQTKYFKK